MGGRKGRGSSAVIAYVFLAIIGIFLILIFIGDAMDSSESRAGAGRNASAPRQASIDVTYSVDLAKEARVTYLNGEGGTEQDTAFSKWQKTFTITQRPFSAYVSAQSEVPADAIVRVRIYAGGKQIKESESYGRYAIASATANFDW